MSEVWDWNYAISILPALFKGLQLTVVVTVVSAALALPFGWLIAILGRSPRWVVRNATRLVLNFVRGTPFLIQLFAVFFILPGYGIMLTPFAAGVLTLSVHYAAYMAEVYRAGIEQIPRGQWDAAQALSLSRPRTWLRIVLPQVIKTSAPALGNYIVTMYKETAVLLVIGMPALLGTAQVLGNESYRFFEPYTMAALLYLIVTYPSSRFIRLWEGRQ